MKKILVIEDNELVRENVVELLELDGFVCREAADGREGIRLALEETPDLILCDVMMPELDGYAVLKIIRRNEKLKFIPFLFLTAKVELADVRKGMGLGADDYILKPYDDADLLDAIHVRLERFHAMHQLQIEEKQQQFVHREEAQKMIFDFFESAETRTYRPKDEVIARASYPRYVFFVKSGLLKSSNFNVHGKELIDHFYTPGSMFGYTDFMIRSKAMCSIMAVETTELAFQPVQDFQAFLYKNKDSLILFAERELLKKRKNTAKLIDLAYASLREKVAQAILSFTELYTPTIDTIHISRSDLAAYSGLAKETVIRTLSEFKQDGILSVKNNSITVNDRNALIALLSGMREL